LHVRAPIFKRSHLQASHRKTSTGSGTMPSLYDLLGALPGDDAGHLRKAFREAVKGVHPDIRPGDPEAALNFRLIVRAMEILADTEQRAAYDHLLEHARQEFAREQRAARLRNFAFAMIALAGVSIVAVSAQILFAPLAALPPQAGQTDQLSRRPPEIASNSPSAGPGSSDNSASRDAEVTKPPETQDDFLQRWGTNDTNLPADQKAEAAKPPEDQHHQALPPDTNETKATADRNAEIAAPGKSRDDLQSPPDAGDNSVPADRTAETTTVAKPPAVEAPGPKPPAVDAPGPTPPARHDDADGIKAVVEPHDKTDPSAAMHAQGILAYRSGDLKLALADFDRAIALNPAFMIAYIDRGIVLYRMGKLDRALADVARARRINRADRARSAAALDRPNCCAAAE
jgi:curved DNA-binding protein CbpA